MLTSYRELKAWQLAMTLVAEIHRITRELPLIEQRELGAQLRRAAVSVPSNIAEGYGRRHRREYVQFVSIALGSLCEVETQLLLVRAIHPTKADSVDRVLALTDQVNMLASALRRSLMHDRPARGHFNPPALAVDVRPAERRRSSRSKSATDG